MVSQQRRYNIYAVIHKALRAQMSHSLLEVGRTDWADAAERAQTLLGVEQLLHACGSHLQHENDFLHTAMEARRPGSAAHTATEHRGHQREIAALLALCQCIAQTPDGAAREASATQLYRQLARFVAENFEHMEVEESSNNAVLWAEYSDAEILAIEHRLVASIPPEEMMGGLRWMLPYANHTERSQLLAGMRQQAPAEAFAGVMAMLQPLLRGSERSKLEAALAVA
ncbi:MAG: hypothetical protein Q8Q73_13485 [Stagnimonas sp.]|nr:hypothetical protein [Stagnimonas sp.]